MQSFTNKQTNREAAMMNSTRPSPMRAPALPLRQLRGALGNQAFGRVIQAKLQISQPGDEYELEADRMAEQVMRMPDASLGEPVTGDAPPPISRLQRKCAQYEDEEVQRQPMKEEEEEASLQSKEVPGHSPQDTPAVRAQIDGLRGGGQPLPESTRAFFEPRFGRDFSQVRVHTDAQAAESARAVNARAFTLGRNVVFSAGEYSPQTNEGRRLLAHELTHTIQQDTAGPTSVASPASHVQRKTPPGTPPAYGGCSVDTTLVDNPNQQLDRARIFARDLIDAALAAIERNDTSDTYRIALARHFRNPTFEQLKDIYKTLRKLWFHLKPEHFRCASTDDEQDECEKGIGDAGITSAFTEPDKFTPSVLCASFFTQSLPCQAKTLIHESAHFIGIGNAEPHPSRRGEPGYPSLAGVPPAAQTAAARMDNPDAYAYFAMHIGRETDTQCVIAPVFTRGVIKIEEKKPEKK
jgi:hypothetical protein